MSIERYLFLTLLTDVPLLIATARTFHMLRWRRVVATAALVACYSPLAAAIPFPWRLPWIQLTVLFAACALLTGRRKLIPLMEVAVLLCAGAAVAAGMALLLRRFPLLPAMAACFLFIPLFARRRRMRINWVESLRLCRDGCSVRVNALIDTGNRLLEPFSGLPVLIVEQPLVREILPEKGLRYVSFGGLGGAGTLSCFKPDAIWREDCRHPQRMPDAWVAVSPVPLPGPHQALAPSEYADV